MAALDVQEFIQQNRALAEQVETFRGISESDKHWQARREFILRNISDYDEPQLDQLLSLSMVWANNVFLGCRCVSALLLHRVCVLTRRRPLSDSCSYSVCPLSLKTGMKVSLKYEVHSV